MHLKTETHPVTRFEIVIRQRTPVAALLFRFVLLAALIGAVVVASGCATLTGESTQSIQVVIVDARDRPAPGLHCEITHDGGNESFKSPAATLSIRRGAEPLEIDCRRNELMARGTAISRGENALAHAFIPGGSLGAVIDHLTGKMYSYPTPLRLRVGEHLRFEHSDAATATLVAPVGAQLAANQAAQSTPPAVAAAPSAALVTAAVPLRVSAVRVTSVTPLATKPTVAPPALPDAAGDSLDARDLRLRASNEKK